MSYEGGAKCYEHSIRNYNDAELNKLLKTCAPLRYEEEVKCFRRGLEIHNEKGSQ